MRQKTLEAKAKIYVLKLKSTGGRRFPDVARTTSLLPLRTSPKDRAALANRACPAVDQDDGATQQTSATFHGSATAHLVEFAAETLSHEPMRLAGTPRRQ